MLINQLSVFIENKKGHLSKITKVLKDASVDIRAISVFDSAEFGILRMVVDKPDEGVAALKNAGHVVKQSFVLAVEPSDKVGSFHDVFNVLFENDLNIEYVYSFVMPNNTGAPLIILKVDDQEKAIDVLTKSGIIVIPKEEIYNPS
ncbi:amino acid-binding protein [Acetobacterium bakii]|uniref:Amino acid-binding protein n=1 Tax=Acetobacterium bakii TaxID=52689 RepID=A0A0L6TXQ0_9FIRM|nr:amino acid-binding protein [Acetobacterium bakii]KNZ41046.1 amino acid-binding protein [Acetobacterium bakii]